MKDEIKLNVYIFYAGLYFGILFPNQNMSLGA